MKEEYVSFEQAVKLKELGFDWRTYAYYSEKDRMCRQSVSLDHNANDGGKKELCSAPTLALAQKWLREEKGVLVWVTPDKQPIDDDYSDIELTGEWWWEVDGRVREDSGDTYKSYELALSAGIDAALELLTDKLNGK